MRGDYVSRSGRSENHLNLTSETPTKGYGVPMWLGQRGLRTPQQDNRKPRKRAEGWGPQGAPRVLSSTHNV
ncbi:unnamed protein product [Prunus armeniaca]|uniref:Uncharacterized protein n=1 Tax=Prunus armeniaca TaxID=36596 RepID=A0A6J5UDK9_PRUAR|nr:unnamed protein product [Prunus armeniaca]